MPKGIPAPKTRGIRHRNNKRVALSDGLLVCGYIGQSKWVDRVLKEKKRDDMTDSLLQALWTLRPQCFTATSAPTPKVHLGTVASFDVGLRNMGLCILRANPPTVEKSTPQTILSKDIEILHWERFDILEESNRKIRNANAATHAVLVECALASLHRRIDFFEYCGVDEVVLEIQPSRAGGTRAVAWAMYAYYEALGLANIWRPQSLRVCSASKKLSLVDLQSQPIRELSIPAYQLWLRTQKLLPIADRSPYLTEDMLSEKFTIPK